MRGTEGDRVNEGGRDVRVDLTGGMVREQWTSKGKTWSITPMLKLVWGVTWHSNYSGD